MPDFFSSNKTPPPDATENYDDLAAVRDTFGADFMELAKLYQEDSPSRIAKLRQAGAAGDHESVARAAHSFSGSNASIGATTLSALCKMLEIEAKTAMPENFDERLAAIEAEYERIRGKLQSMTQENSRG